MARGVHDQFDGARKESNTGTHAIDLFQPLDNAFHRATKTVRLFKNRLFFNRTWVELLFSLACDMKEEAKKAKKRKQKNGRSQTQRGFTAR